MKGDLITQMFEEMGIKVVDVTPKAKDWQFRPMRDGETFAIFTNKPSKKIPIEVWTELIYAPESEVHIDNIKFIDKNGINTPYLVTIKE